MVSEDIQNKVNKKVCLACAREFTGVVSACPHDGTVLVPLAQDPLIGTKLAERYQILSLVGQGGMGNVYRARHELMERDVAIKMLKSDLISDASSVKRFQVEARAACRLKHPNVITLFDFGVSPSGQPYLVMDYLVGISLADVIKKEGHVGVDRSIKIFLQACRALEHAHRAGVIHRDLKPGNIMLIDTDDEKDFVKVVDFGVAKLITGAEDSEAQRLTQTGEVCGSPVYMSPEQCMGQRLAPTSDIYSMAVVIYEALTGRLPLLGKTMVDTMSKHISEQPPPFGKIRPDLYIPERLEAVVFKALSKSPEDRQQSMAELEKDLELAIPKPGRSQALRTTVQPVDGIKLPPRVSSTQAKSTPVGAIIAVVLALLVFVGGAVAWMSSRKPTSSEPAVKTSVPKPEQPAVAPQTVTPPPAVQHPEKSNSAESGTGKNSGEDEKSPQKSAASVTAASPERTESPTTEGTKTPLVKIVPEPSKSTPARRHPSPPARSQKTIVKHQPAARPPAAKVKHDDPFADLARSRSYKPE